MRLWRFASVVMLLERVTHKIDGGNGMAGVYVYGSKNIGEYEVYIGQAMKEKCTYVSWEANKVRNKTSLRLWMEREGGR